MIPYDPRSMSWDQWSSLMAELFAGQPLAAVPEVQWRAWVDNMQSISFFSQQMVPDHTGYATWQQWAEAVVGIVKVH